MSARNARHDLNPLLLFRQKLIAMVDHAVQVCRMASGPALAAGLLTHANLSELKENGASPTFMH